MPSLSDPRAFVWGESPGFLAHLGPLEEILLRVGDSWPCVHLSGHLQAAKSSPKCLATAQGSGRNPCPLYEAGITGTQRARVWEFMGASPDIVKDSWEAKTACGKVRAPASCPWEGKVRAMRLRLKPPRGRQGFRDACEHNVNSEVGVYLKGK